MPHYAYEVSQGLFQAFKSLWRGKGTHRHTQSMVISYAYFYLFLNKESALKSDLDKNWY
jgi:hypothetical protein